MQGVQQVVTHDGVHIFRLHYTADPDKDPNTPQGKAWLGRELVGYPGGLNDPRWRREMEIDFDAFAGQLLFPYLIEYENRILCEPITRIPDEWDISAGFDYGTRNPSAFILTGWNRKTGNPTTFFEYYQAPQRKEEADEVFRSRKGYQVVASAIKTCPWWSEMERRKTVINADSSLWNKTQETKHGLRSIVDLLRDEGIKLMSPAPKGKGSDMAWYELISKRFWVNPKEPRWRITRDCTWLWKELKGLRFAEHSASATETHNLKDEIVDKDNHATDAAKYDFAAHFILVEKPARDPKDWLDRRIDQLKRPPTVDADDIALWEANRRFEQSEEDREYMESIGLSEGDVIEMNRFYAQNRGRMISTIQGE